MTLTLTPRISSAPVSRSAPVRRAPVPIATLVLDDVYRVEYEGAVIGYVQLAGPVFVALHGAVYNTSLEVGQHLDLESALTRLAAARSH